ncbi:hypothetical protein PoB_006179500 [Plakobranchus ocellatus]|uniref:Uncharacterized protein n=1 Tax=Plakobranchus ocellatus TaxID=259542 RepID=A0AAV4CTW2_9GAST|nr:hypothetical protein PoB_006179500 [Plakobranchus ocellatus]
MRLPWHYCLYTGPAHPSLSDLTGNKLNKKLMALSIAWWSCAVFIIHNKVIKPPADLKAESLTTVPPTSIEGNPGSQCINRSGVEGVALRSPPLLEVCNKSPCLFEKAQEIFIL